MGFLIEIAFVYLNVSDRNNSREQRRIRSIHHSGVSSSADTLNKGHILDPDQSARAVRVKLTRNWTRGWLRYVNWIFSVIFVFVRRVFNTKNWRKINDPNVLRNEWNSWKWNENNDRNPWNRFLWKIIKSLMKYRESWNCSLLSCHLYACVWTFLCNQ